MIKMLTALALTAALLPAAGGEVHYVALGDSVAAGPGILNQVGPAACSRSDHNYPSLLARALKPATFKDVSCTGAELRHLSESQVGEKPQLDALSDETTLVTLTVGANSLNWAKLAFNCGLVSIGTLGHGNPCQRTQGKKVLAAMERLRPAVTEALENVRAKAPKARILVIGYLKTTPSDGTGCWPKLPLASGDGKYFDRVERKLNTMLKESSTAVSAEYVDVYTMSEGHGICSAEPWSAGLAGPSLVYHPTREGMEAISRRILEVIA